MRIFFICIYNFFIFNNHNNKLIKNKRLKWLTYYYYLRIKVKKENSFTLNIKLIWFFNNKDFRLFAKKRRK